MQEAQRAQRSEKSPWIDEKGRAWSKVVDEVWEAQMQK